MPGTARDAEVARADGVEERPGSGCSEIGRPDAVRVELVGPPHPVVRRAAREAEEGRAVCARRGRPGAQEVLSAPADDGVDVERPSASSAMVSTLTARADRGLPVKDPARRRAQR